MDSPPFVGGRGESYVLVFSTVCWGSGEGYLSYLVFCVFFCLSSFCVLCPLLPMSLDCPFLIAPSVFSNVYYMYAVTH
jgi:hypothetical protein